jgi:NitT/TauT family transport system substrate-binding protein
MVAPNTTRSSPAHSALDMHIGHGSQVEYIVYPARVNRFSFLQASRTARNSACAEGSDSAKALLVARINRAPVCVSTINAPNGTGLGVSIVRAVKATISPMRSLSTGSIRARREELTDISNFSMAADAGKQRQGPRGPSLNKGRFAAENWQIAPSRVLPYSMRKAFFAPIFLTSLLPITLLAAGCYRSSIETAGLTKVTLQADWYPQPEHGGFYTAIVKGYYRDEGLGVTIHPGGPYVTVEQQVSSGAAQFGLGSSDRTLESIADGQPLVAVAATMQHDPQGIMVRKNSPVHSFADLNGHTIAIKPGSTWWEFVEKHYNLTNVHEIPATMSVATFVASPDYIQQAFATSEPFFAQQAGIETRVLLTSDAGYNPYRVMFTTRDFLAQHPDVVGKFVRASLRGWKEYLNDPAAAHAAIVQLNPALSPQWMQFTWQALRDGHFVAGEDPSGAQLGQMDARRWALMYQQLIDLKVISKPFDPTTAYTLQFVHPN